MKKTYLRVVQLNAKQSKQTAFNNINNSDFNKMVEELLKKLKEQQQQQQSYYKYTNQNQTQSVNLQNAYQLFKLPSTSSVDEIKTKYRELAFKWHPDRCSTESISNQNIAKRNFQKLQSAYELIKKDKGIN